MIRILTLLAVCAALGPLARAQENQLDSNKSLFAVFLARAAAGYDSPGAPDAHPARAGLLAKIEAAHPASLDALKTFFAAHLGSSQEADQNQYISFALVVQGPPNFAYRYQADELPPEVLPLAGFDRLLAAFWREADLDALWNTAGPVYDQILEAYHGPVTQTLFQTNAYLRNPTSGYLGRRFEVYVDIAGPPGVIQSRSYKDDYSVVVTPSGASMEKVNEAVAQQIPQIRHSYLHYLLDPLGIKYAVLFEQKRSLEDISDTAPALGEMYKKDFLLLATESLIKAVETRLEPASARAGMVEAALKQGYILTPYFAGQLPGYEKQQQSMRLYLPEMINGIDVLKETQRLESVKFDPAPAQAPKATAPAKLPPGQQALMDAESLSFDKKYEDAKAAFQKVLQEADTGGLHARAYFGLGRIAALEKNPELAEQMFEKTLELKPDARTESWAKLYLGRLAAAAGEDQQAAAYYRAAVAVEGGSAQARREAQKLLGGSPERKKQE